MGGKGSLEVEVSTDISAAEESIPSLLFYAALCYKVTIMWVA